MALFVVAGFGTAFAVQTNGMTSNNQLVGSGAARLPQAGLNALSVNDFANGLTAGLDVNVNPDALGDTLIYNYFNARSDMATFFSVVNTSSLPIRARVRFHEGANIAGSTCTSGSWEILDFDVCLTPNDMWTGYVKQVPSGSTPNTNGGQICSVDNHTLVWDNVSSHTLGTATGGEGCFNFKYGPQNPVSGITADNTLEGYFTIIGEYVQNNVPYAAANYTCDPTSRYGTYLGTGTVGDVPNALTGYAFVADIADPANSPFYGYNATAIADFNNVALNTANVFASETPTLSADGGDLLRGINYILTKEQVMSTYLLWDSWETELVLTFPTKRYTETAASCSGIFHDPRVTITVWDDDENTHTSGCQNSPCIGAADDQIPYELNVLPVNMLSNTNFMMPSTLHAPNGSVIQNGTISTQDYDRGWVNINFNSATTTLVPLHQTIANEGATGTAFTAHGWPVLSLQLLNYKNFSGAVPMAAKTNITTAAGTAATTAPY